MAKQGKTKDGKPKKDHKHGKKHGKDKDKERDMDSGEGLQTGEDFQDDFEPAPAVAVNRQANDDSDSGEEETSSKPMGRKQLLKAAAAASGVKKDKKTGGKITKPSTDGSSKKSAAGEGSSGLKNKQRVMALSSRGITQRYRHLLHDLVALMPHAKTESKYDSKSNLYLLNELSELNNCNNCLFFEVRRATDLYMWVSKTPNGPSAKFHVQNVHTMNELRMTGNCLKGSRPLLSFDKAFEEEPHLQVLKEMFTQTFGVPRTSRKLKPFVDHIMSFYVLDGRIWIRNYQIVEQTSGDDAGKTSLVEIGPRIVLKLIRIFDGSFSGSTLYSEKDYQTPASIRRAMKKIQQSGKYVGKKMNKEYRKDRKEALLTEIPDEQKALREVFG